jgi:hypothetical protein
MEHNYKIGQYILNIIVTMDPLRIGKTNTGEVFFVRMDIVRIGGILRMRRVARVAAW